MRAVVQKVKKAKLYSNNEFFSEIQGGMLVLLGVEPSDTDATAERMVQKLLKLRIFKDENDKVNLNIFDANGQILLVSNFTLCGSFKGTNRPDFSKAASPELAERLYNKVYNILSRQVHTATGVFRTHMDIEMVADGPGTYVLEIE